MKSLFFIVALLLPFTLAAPVDLDETALTPVGFIPASNAHTVPAGGSVNFAGDEIHLIDADKRIIHVAHVNDTGGKVPQPSAWVAYASWYNTDTSPISYFLTDWAVPPLPSTDNGQTVFLFNSIEPASYDAMLQPVLQYGPSAAGGGPYWTIANWYVYGNNHAYFTSLVNVTEGQVLRGIMSLTSSDDSGYSYDSSFYDIGDTLTVTNIDKLVWATETLESYNVVTGSDYPAGSTDFDNIYLFTGTPPSVPSMSWKTRNDVADESVATVVRDGASDALINIKYGNESYCCVSSSV